MGFVGVNLSLLHQNIILPRLCKTGRFGVAPRPGQTITEILPIEWDDGPPWTFEMEFTEVQNRWVARGYFVRPGERCLVSDAQAVFGSGFMIRSRRLSKLTLSYEMPWIEQLRREEGISIPVSDLDPFFEKLVQIPYLPKIHWPESLSWKFVEEKPIKGLSLLSAKRHSQNTSHLLGTVCFFYGNVEIPFNTSDCGVVNRKDRTIHIRDRKYEWDAFAEVLGHKVLRPSHHLRNECDVLLPTRVFVETVRSLLAKGWDVESERVQIRPLDQIKIEITSGIDWFDLKMKSRNEPLPIDISQLREAIRNPGSLVKLGNGSQGIIPEQWLEKYAFLAQFGEVHGDGLRFKKSQGVLLDALLQDKEESIKVDRSFTKAIDKVRDSLEPRLKKEPKAFKGKLRKYQREGLGWLEYLNKVGIGGCLADDMGLGKTIQILALLQTVKSKLPTLVVVPKSLVFSWISEAKKFTPALSVLDYTGPGRREVQARFSEADIILTTYGTVRTDILELSKLKFFYIILDESQMIKNYSSQIAKAVRLLHSEHRLVLTGTPIENHIGELWSQLDFLNPGMLGGATAFKQTTMDLDEQKDWLSSLSVALKPFILRRTKEQVLKELPPKSEQILYCDFEEEEQLLYDKLRDHYRSDLIGTIEEKGLNKSKMLILEALLRMRQASCHYGLIDKKRTIEDSAKTRALMSRLTEILESGHKALIFSQFTSFLSIVREKLNARGITYEYLDGSTSDRKERVTRFQSDPKCPLFLLSLKAGGVGLNLTAADYVFLLDPWWNPAVEAQAVDRTHRIGQKKPVMVYRIITRNTVEEKVLELQTKKKALFNKVLSSDQSLLRKITVDDLKTLLS